MKVYGFGRGAEGSLAPHALMQSGGEPQFAEQAQLVPSQQGRGGFLIAQQIQAVIQQGEHFGMRGAGGTGPGRQIA